MAKKLLETSLGNWSTLVFNVGNKAISTEQAVERFKQGCGDYDIYSQDGVVVYMTKKEFEQIKDRLNIK